MVLTLATTAYTETRRAVSLRRVRRRVMMSCQLDNGNVINDEMGEACRGKIQFDELAGRPDMTGKAACPTGRKSELKDSVLNM